MSCVLVDFLNVNLYQKIEQTCAYRALNQASSILENLSKIVIYTLCTRTPEKHKYGRSWSRTRVGRDRGLQIFQGVTIDVCKLHSDLIRIARNWGEQEKISLGGT
jgi:hypothetical protein